MAKYKVEQIEDGWKKRRTAVVDESRVSETRAAFRQTMRKSKGESSDTIRVTKR